ncbi:transcriptional regulator [Cellulomonas hominis]|uniref:Transcriptional regulator n=1 Tax=Cellulomonas hominis TaxID=156981 RepID=A0A511FEI5_9CELL|nr:FCD domain-containing protein [Cellulomonas hominis]MBB5472674.1 DNA-binding FadR family transcriptional regulator [Cellulomonas hominis]GEL46737.1 transcriptional regulator [Cellulomonas hominis]
MGVEVLHSTVLEVIGSEITAGALPEGSVLTLEQIQQRFAVSRTVARETMRMLEHLGLVTSRRRVGLVVRPAADWMVFDPRVIRWRLAGPGRLAQLRSLTELRAAVEPVAAAAAARHADPGEVDRLLVLVARMRELGEAGRLDEFVVCDIEFHALLLRAGRNEMFAALTGVVAEVLAGRTRHGLMPDRPRPEALDAHDAVADAIRARDPEAAERAMTVITTEIRAALSDLH